MNITKALNEELKATVGTFAPQVFRREGIIGNLAAPVETLRAEGLYSLFSLPVPVVLKNELVAGNLKFVHVDISREDLDAISSEWVNLGERDFSLNKDHYAPNYEHILSVGTVGLNKEIADALVKHAADEKRVTTLKAMERALNGFEQMIENHAVAIEKTVGTSGYDDNRLKRMAENCRALLQGPPKTFAQALQLMWFCHLAFLMEGRYAMALGRVDQFLYPFYKKDIENGTLTDDQAVLLLENVFIRLQNDVVNIAVGGRNKDGGCDINGLSYCVLRAVGNCNVPGPNLSFRATIDAPDDFWDLALCTIGTGLGYPALMNDEINIAALRRFGYAEEDCYNYSMVGCIENFITGKQPPWSDGRFDTPKYINITLNEGKNSNGIRIGAETRPIDEMETMDDFMEALKAQLSYAADEYYYRFRNRNDGINQAHYSEPFLSLFCYDCIGRGLDINNGGAIYPSAHGVAIMGIATMADSLAAVEKLVFIDKKYTLRQIKEILDSNFEGFEDARRDLMSVVKYGNNDDFVDKYAVWITKYAADLFDRYKTRDGGYVYTAMAANTSNIWAGKTIGATPDGRRAGEPLSDAASPTYGRDTRGATASINSLSKPDYTACATGSVVNQKYSPSMFKNEEKRKKLLALIKTYFKKGGQEIQINATSREVLIDAMNHPENYQNLVVRVSGFSAFYVTLEPEVQLDILNRTQQE